MDIFLPLDADLRDLPVLLFMHGGAWTHGTKDWCDFMAPPIVQLPATFVSVGYRLIPHVSFPEPVMDCTAALRWTFDHIAEFGGSPKKLMWTAPRQQYLCVPTTHSLFLRVLPFTKDCSGTG